MMIGEPCLTQSRVHFKSKLVAVPAGFWTGQARSRTAPSMVIVFALGSILVPGRASSGPSSDTLIAVANTAWNKVEHFISLLWRATSKVTGIYTYSSTLNPNPETIFRPRTGRLSLADQTLGVTER